MTNENKIRIIILAAGKGTRMKNGLPKVLAPLHGKHMIRHLLESVDETGIDEKPIIIVGYEKELVMKELGDKYEYVTQKEQLGTGHAVYSAKDACEDVENVIVISGDQPFIKSETIKNLYLKHSNSNAKITICTSVLPDYEDWRKAFTMYGRISRKDERIIDIEYKDATEEEKKIKEINVSFYAFNAKWLWKNLEKIINSKIENVQKEYYLTDLFKIASDNNKKIETIQMSPLEALGANSKEELEILEKLLV